MPVNLQQQATQAAQQGQQLLSSFNASADQSKNNYNTYSTQANQANQQLQGAADYMKGEGSGENVYNRQLNSQETQNGWNPQQLSDANKSLFSLSGALNSTNQQFNTPGGVGAYGMSAPSLASYEGSILNPLQTGVANANTQVGALNSELGTFQTGASQAATAQVQSEQNTVTALTQAVQNYQAQASSAMSNMQFFSDLAQKQGGLNAQQQQSYAQAAQAYAQADQAIAQSKLLLSQTTGQNLTNQAMQNQLNAPKPATPAPNPPTPNPAPNANSSSGNFFTDAGNALGSGLSSWGTTAGRYGPMALLGQGTFWR